MGKYIVRRLLQMIPVIIGTTFLIFYMVFALPGDPTAGKCGDRRCPESYIAKYRAEHNLDDPLPIQYTKYVGKLVQGDLGTNQYGVKVTDDLKKRFWVTGKLALMAIAVEIVIGIFAGNIVPASWQLEFAIPLSFIAILVGSVGSVPMAAAAVVGGFASVLLFSLPLKLGLVVACLAGLLAGVFAEKGVFWWTSRKAG